MIRASLSAVAFSGLRASAASTSGRPTELPERLGDDHQAEDQDELEASDLDVLADGRVSYRGEPFATVRGRRAPSVAR